MTRPPGPPPVQSDVGFEAYLNSADDYCDAANALLARYDAEHAASAFDLRAQSPIFMLLIHAAELAFKAFLLFKGKPALYLKNALRHNLVKIHDEAVAEGFVPGALSMNLTNVVGLLHSGNKEEGFRYFNVNNTSLPEIHFAAETVTELVVLVKQATAHLAVQQPGPAAKLILVVGKSTSPPATKNQEFDAR